MPGTASRNLALNLAALRGTRRMSQQHLADKAEIPRSTITNIESGAANPSLDNLVRLSAALGVGIDELIAEPRDECVLILEDRIPVRQLSGGKVRVHDLLPERIKGMHIERMELQAGASMRGTPHVTGAKEYLHVTAGTVSVVVAGRTFAVPAGAVLAFPGAQPHSYINRGGTHATALSVVVPAPVLRASSQLP